MSPRRTSFFERLFGVREREVRETSPVLHRTLSRAVDDLDRKFTARRSGAPPADRSAPELEKPARAS